MVFYTSAQMDSPSVLSDWSESRLALVGEKVIQLYRIVEELNQEFEQDGKRFTPDGVMVGHLGEVLAAYLFDLELLPCSSPGHDARTRGGLLVQIKMTGGAKSVSLRKNPDHLIVLQLYQGELKLVYNGEGRPVWTAASEGKNIPSNGQFPVTLSVLRRLDLIAKTKLPQVRALPQFASSTDTTASQTLDSRR